MNWIKRMFNADKPKNPEDYFKVIMTDSSVVVKCYDGKMEKILWDDINEIYLVNTDEGPATPDIWLELKGENGRCLIPHGSKGCDKVYEIVSKYEGFDFENVIKSMACARNAIFLLWKRK